MPKIAAILTAIGPPGLFFLLTRYAQMTQSDATVISGLAFSVLVAAGLATVKQSNVSNSPTPLSVAKSVAAPVEKEKDL